MLIEADGKLWLSLAPDGGGALFGGAAARNAGLLEISLVRGEEDVPYTYTSDGFAVTLKADGSELRFAVDADVNAVRIEGGTNATLRLDGKNPGGTTLNTGTAADLTIGGGRYYLIAKRGSYTFDDTWVLNAFGSVRAVYDLAPDNGAIELIAYTLDADTEPKTPTRTLEQVVADNKEAYEAFLARMVDVPAEYAELKAKVAYTLWTSYKHVSAVADAVVADRLKSPAIVPSEQAIAALAFKDAEIAAKLIVSAEKSYPPIAGLAAFRLVKEVPRKLLIPLHHSLANTAEWWLKNRYKDGKFFYAYRFETGIANPKAFRAGEAVESPDLYAYLYLLFLTLHKCETELNNTYAATVWKERADAITEGQAFSRLVDNSGDGTKYLARSVNTGETAEVDEAVSRIPLFCEVTTDLAVSLMEGNYYKYEVSEPTVLDALCGGYTGDTDNAIIGAALLYRASLRKEEE
jgi:hypothetical protein